MFLAIICVGLTKAALYVIMAVFGTMSLREERCIIPGIMASAVGGVGIVSTAIAILSHSAGHCHSTAMTLIVEVFTIATLVATAVLLSHHDDCHDGFQIATIISILMLVLSTICWLLLKVRRTVDDIANAV